MTVTCPVCGTANPDGSRFCNGCGSRLPEVAALAEERKVITALFCDLVGFTATSEGADPEDVDRMLSRYFAMARMQIEAHGGVVEKFIGDAVVGVFGVPSAHEDDPERAIRAALRICDEAGSLPALRGTPLRLRVGINTGEALVRLNVVPGAGERFLAGDAINTASRIQSVAPEMGVAVGQATFDATRLRFEYAELPPAVLKGKAEPIRVFHAVAPRARLGTDPSRSAATPLIGRSLELQRLTDLFQESVAARSIRSATIVGEPGLGKSRLVAELLSYVDAEPVLVTWRQGHCLPYGNGISFWALGEIVKAHAGILESDPAPVALERLDAVLPDTDERAWLRERLLPLVGIDSGSRAEREEQFTAWRRFLELVALQRPTVLVFEDLHWADDAMLEFLEEVTDRGPEVPLLVVSTTRPDLFERRPGFGAASASSTRIDLVPLSSGETGRLVITLLAGTTVAPALQAPILDRAAGNPLFAQEFIRLLRDRDLLVEIDGHLDLRPGEALPTPGSVQALISARLDALPAPWKAVLADASVVGNVFWAGAVSALGVQQPEDLAAALDGLARRQLMHRADRSSMAGEVEYSFGHVLVRDVAYAALPRAVRASRHLAAARWIESRTSERIEDVADVLAHHYSIALDLARAVGEDNLLPDLQDGAFRYLSMAGERALGLDATAAAPLLERALSLAPPDHPERPAALLRFGMATIQVGRFQEGVSILESALAEYRARNDTVGAAASLGALASPLHELGDPRAIAYVREVVDILEPLGPSRQLVQALARRSAAEGIAGSVDASMTTLRRALEMIDAVTVLREGEAMALRGQVTGWIGLMRASIGEAAGFDDVRSGIALTSAAGYSDQAAHFYTNMGSQIGNFDGPIAAGQVLGEGLEFATQRGLLGFVAFFREERLVLNFDTGDHDDLLAGLPEMYRTLESVESVLTLIELRSVEVQVRTLRGEDPDLSVLEWLEDTAHRSGDRETFHALAATAPARLGLGQTAAARALVEELAGVPGHETGTWWFPRLLPTMVRTAVALGDPDLGARLTDGVRPLVPYTEHSLVAAGAVLSEASGELATAVDGYHDAATRWERLGIVPELAFAHLGRGRCLIALDRRTEAAASLQRSREIFERLRAAPALREIDGLMGGTEARLG